MQRSTLNASEPQHDLIAEGGPQSNDGSALAQAIRGNLQVNERKRTLACDLSSASTSVGPIAAASIGLFGVLAGLVSNGWLGRQRIHDERNHEIAVIRTMLIAELTNLFNIIDKEIYHLSLYNETWVPMLDFLRAYRENTEKIALLSRGEASAIATAYYVYQEQIAYVARRAGMKLTETYLGTNADFVFENAPDDQMRKNELIGFLESILPSVSHALIKLKEGIEAAAGPGIYGYTRFPDPHPIPSRRPRVDHPSQATGVGGRQLGHE